MVSFTENCEQAIKSHSLETYLTDLKAQLESYTNVDFISGDDLDTTVLELKLKALILDTIHNIDVVTFLIENKVRDLGEWQWQKQLRSVVIEGWKKGIRMEILLITCSYIPRILTDV